MNQGGESRTDFDDDLYLSGQDEFVSFDDVSDAARPRTKRVYTGRDGAPDTLRRTWEEAPTWLV